MSSVVRGGKQINFCWSHLTSLSQTLSHAQTHTNKEEKVRDQERDNNTINSDFCCLFVRSRLRIIFVLFIDGDICCYKQLMQTAPHTRAAS